MQTRCGTGTNDLTKREKSSLYYEIELSKPWRSFCDRCVEVELENILKETFGGKLGYGLNHRLSVLGNEYKGYKIDLSLNLYADDVETMSSLIDLAFVGKKGGHGVEVDVFNHIHICVDSKGVSAEYDIIPSFCWGNVLRGWVDDPDVFQKMMVSGYKKFFKYLEYRLLLANARAHSAESLAEYAESQAWEIDERGNLSLCFEH